MAFVCAAALAAAEARGQVTTGSFLGTVRDETGAVLSGARATLASPALVGGPLTQATSDRGQYRFPSLPPGIYSLRVTYPGFGDLLEEGISVALGGTVERNLSLKLAPIAETVGVAGAGVDTHRTGVTTNITPEALEKTPVRRSSFFDLLKAAPGISATKPSDGFNHEVSSFGSGIDENVYLLDGANFTGSSYYGPAAAPGTDTVQEIEVISLGASAEHGNVAGAVFNIVTRQGGDHWRLDASYYTMPPGLTAESVRRDCGCPAGESAFERVQYHDLNAYAGGPVLKNRLWIFGGYQRQRDHYSNPGSDPRFPAEGDTHHLSAKLTWQITPRLRLVQAFHDDHWVSPDAPGVGFPYETLVTYEGDGRSVTLADLTFRATEATVLDVRISSFLSPDSSANPNSGSRSLPFHYDLATGTASGGSYSFGSSTRNRLAAKVKLSHYADDFLAARHDFRLGLQYETASEEISYGYPGGAYYYDYAGQPYYAIFREPFGAAAEVRSLGVFAEDVARIGERLTLSLGIRFDRNEVISRDLPALDVEGRKTGAVHEGLGTLYTWNVVSPRLGFNLKLTRDGRTVARGSWGRFHPGLLTLAVQRIHPGLTPSTSAFFDPSTGEYSDVASVTDPIRDQRIDPRIRAPSTDQLSIGFDRELPAGIIAGLTYVRKDGREFTGWQDIGGEYGTGTTTLEDGRVLPVYPLLNSPSERLYLLTNPQGRFLRYDGLLLTLQRRWSKGWQALVSYSLSEARGLVASSGSGPASGQFTDGARSDFGRDPNDLTNATGNLANDRTHMFRVQAAAEISKVGMLIGVSFQYLTGKPWAGEAIVRLPQGTRPIFVEPRGSRRLAAQSLLDLRLSKTLRLGRKVRAELLMDVLNVLNEAAEEAVVSRNVASSNFAEGSRFVEPRRVMLGLRLGFDTKP